jgi:hypothetical protein
MSVSVVCFKRGVDGNNPLEIKTMAVTISTFATLPMLRPIWLTALARGEALVWMRGEVWKLQVPLRGPVSDSL